MSSKFYLTKAGLKRKSWDSELKGQCRLKKENGKYVYRNKETKEIVSSGDTVEEAEEIFWKPDEITNVYTHLREIVELEEGYTTRDFVNFVRNSDLHDIAVVLFAEDYYDMTGFALGGTTLQRSAWLKDDVLTIRHNTRHHSGDLLRVDKKFSIYNEDNEEILTGPLEMSLLDMMICMWNCLSAPEEQLNYAPAGEHERPTLYFRPEGLTHATGELIEDPFLFLLSPVEIIEGTTLLDVFNYVDSDPGFADFLSCYSWCRGIREFHREARLPNADRIVEKDPYSGGLIHTHVTRYLYLSQYKRAELPHWCESIDFGAIGHLSEDMAKHYQERGEDLPETQHYGISFSGCESYSRLPVVIDNKIEIHRDMFVDKGKVYPQQDFFTCTCPMTLLEFLDGIYWEISFYGTPEHRDEQWACIKTDVDDFKERMEDAKSHEDVKAEVEGVEPAISGNVDPAELKATRCKIDEEGNFITEGKRYKSVNEMMRDIDKDDYDPEILDEMYPTEEDD